MHLLLALAVVCLTLAAPPLSALADSPTPTPTAPPPRASPSPSASAPAAPSPSASPRSSASPTPSPAVAEEVTRTAGAPVEEMRRVIAATSLAERIDAERTLAAAERRLLLDRGDRIRAESAAATARAAELAAKLEEQRAVLERLVQQAYRASRTSPLEAFLGRWSVVDLVVHVDRIASLADEQRETVDRVRALEADAQRVREDLARQQGELDSLREAVAAKDATLAQLSARAELLVAAARRGPSAVSDAEIEVLRALADDAAREHAAADAQIAAVARSAGVELPRIDRWVWPSAGVVTQGFGPSALALEPAVTYRGTAYPHFHDGIDVGAALGAPVLAAAKGRVAFVGHIAGGAEVVILAHAGGMVSLYAHLDDTLTPPPVRAGDVVEAGQRIGSVGLTGITTGAHLHFVVRRGDEPLDPRTVLPGRTAP